VESDLAKNERAKKMELAGLRSMADEIQAELQAYQIAELEKSVRGLQSQLSSNDTTDVKATLSETLHVIEQLLVILRPLHRAN
jgi:vacuolar-type H+-ATPase subunit I/STV1